MHDQKMLTKLLKNGKGKNYSQTRHPQHTLGNNSDFMQYHTNSIMWKNHSNLKGNLLWQPSCCYV